jgi:hypothetical protein
METSNMKSRRTIRQRAAGATFVAVAACALWPASVSAQELSDEWKFRGSIYFWMPTFSGTANLAGNNTVDFDINFHTLWDTLKMGGMGNIEVQKGRWGGFADFIYLDLGAASATTRDRMIDGIPVPVEVNLNTNLDFKGFISTFAGSYRLQAEPGSSFDVFAGARFLWLDLTLNYDLSTDVGSLQGPQRSGSRKSLGTTWDGIVGAKGRMAFGDNREWFVPYYADVGTGQSKITYQAAAGIGYAFSWGEVVATWRYLYWKEPGDKVDKLSVNGPQVAVAFNW